MDFAFSAEQEMLRGAARDWLGDRYPIDRVVELADSDAGWDPGVWTELTELGWLDPELELLEHAVLAEEAGQALLPAPWFSSVGAGRAGAGRVAGAADDARVGGRRGVDAAGRRLVGRLPGRRRRATAGG